MTKLLLIAIAAAALAGCDSKPEVVQGGGPYDPQAGKPANTNVELPPSIVASAKYRCKDNSVVSIDWLSTGTKNSANVTVQGQPMVSLAQAEPDGDYTAEGTTLSGGPRDPSVTFNGKSCRK